MAETDRCGEVFWGVTCDRPVGHRSVHSGKRGRARLSWGGQADSNLSDKRPRSQSTSRIRAERDDVDGESPEGYRR